MLIDTSGMTRLTMKLLKILILSAVAVTLAAHDDAATYLKVQPSEKRTQ